MLADERTRTESSMDTRRKLTDCDGVMLYRAVARQSWFERAHLLRQAFAWREGRQFAVKVGLLSAPESPIKQNFDP